MDLSRMFNPRRPSSRRTLVLHYSTNPILTDPILGLDLRIARAVWSF
jgi:hypothetical protein